MRISVIQYHPTADRNESLEKVDSLIDDAAARDADVVLLPELFSIPFVPKELPVDYFDLAEPLNGPSNSLVAKKSAEHGICIVSSIFEKGDIRGVYYNTACVYRAGDSVHVYRKSHVPFSHGFREKFYFRAASRPPTPFSVLGRKVGLLICYERHFPEMVRLLALQGSEVILVPNAAASAASRKVFQLELRAHAVFNQVYVAAANRVGEEGEQSYYGLSGIYGPDGEILAEGNDREEDVLLAEVDLDEVEKQRRDFPLFRDRRPSLYHGLVEDQEPAAVLGERTAFSSMTNEPSFPVADQP